MLIGYYRFSTHDQTGDLQTDALRKAGCEKIYGDQGVSGSKTDRPELTKALADLRAGDTLVVWRLDRLGRSLPHLIEVVNGLNAQGVEFRSLQETIDTSSATGKLVFHVMAAMAEFERDLIRERTNAGLAAARARGRNGGRPKALSPEKVQIARTLYQAKQMTVAAICDQVGCSRATFYKQVAQGS
jgi:DNA invertase Pin-like site-specific DNA recombinase